MCVCVCVYGVCILTAACTSRRARRARRSFLPSRLERSELHALLINSRIVHAFLDLPIDRVCRLHESRLYIISRLGGGFHENKAMLVREILTFFEADGSSGFQVALVPDEHDGHIRVAVLLSLSKPSVQVVEGLSPGDIVDQQSTGRISIVRACDGSEGFLARLKRMVRIQRG